MQKQMQDVGLEGTERIGGSPDFHTEILEGSVRLMKPLSCCPVKRKDFSSRSSLLRKGQLPRVSLPYSIRGSGSGV